MTNPLRGDPTVRDEVVRIAEYTVNTSVLEGMTFVNCRMIGPAVLVFLNAVEMSHCTFNAPNLEAVFWEIATDRQVVVGVVGVSNCTFSNCTFENVGLAGPPEMRLVLESGFRPAP